MLVTGFLRPVGSYSAMQGLTFGSAFINQWTTDGSVGDPPGADNGIKFYIGVINADYFKTTITAEDDGSSA